MAELSTIARPYAEAAFDLARGKNALPAWSGMLELVAAVATDARMSAALASPKLGDAEKESLFLSVCGDRLDADARSFVRVLIESDRIGVAREIREIYEKRRNDAEVGQFHPTIAGLTDVAAATTPTASGMRIRRNAARCERQKNGTSPHDCRRPPPRKLARKEKWTSFVFVLPRKRRRTMIQINCV